MHQEHEERKARLIREADQLLYQTASEQGKKAVSAYQEAKRAIAEGAFEQALVRLDESRVLGIAPDPLVDAYALAHFRQNHYSQAIPYLEQRVDRKPELNLFHVMLAESYLATGFSTEAQIQRCLRIYQQFDTPLRRRIVHALAQSFEASGRGDKTAQVIVTEAALIEPGNPSHLAALAKMLNESGKAEEALIYCSSFHGVHSKDSLTQYAAALNFSGKLESDALGVYEKYLAEEPHDARIRLRLCQGLIRAKELRRAIQTYREGLALDPEHIGLRYHLALALQMSGDIDGAIAECQQLLRMPKVETYRAKSDIFLLLGRCFAMKKMFAIAYKQFMLAGDGRAVLDHLYKLGEVALSGGDSDVAKQCWASILTIDINYKDAKAKLGSPSGVTSSA